MVRRCHSKKEGGIQVLANLAPSSQTVGSNIRVIHEQAKRSSKMTEVNIALATLEPSWVRWWKPPCRRLLTKLAYFVLMSFALISLCANVTQP